MWVEMGQMSTKHVKLLQKEISSLRLVISSKTFAWLRPCLLEYISGLVSTLQEFWSVGFFGWPCCHAHDAAVLFKDLRASFALPCSFGGTFGGQLWSSRWYWSTIPSQCSRSRVAGESMVVAGRQMLSVNLTIDVVTNFFLSNELLNFKLGTVISTSLMLHWMQWLQEAKQYTAKSNGFYWIFILTWFFTLSDATFSDPSLRNVSERALRPSRSSKSQHGARCGLLNSSPPGEVTKVMLRSKKNMKVKKAKSRTSRAAQNEGYVNQTVEQFKSLRYPAFVDQKPWLDADGNMVWSQWRMKAGELVFSQSFETAMGLVILFNMGIIMYEADQDALCFPTYYKDLGECPFRSNSFLWLYVLNILLNIVYTLECGIRLYVERGAFFCNKWNLIDLLTLIAGWTASLGQDLANIGEFAVLRMFRLVRVVRAVRVLVSIPEFYLLITGLSSSIKAIIFGSMMLVSVIIFWAVISVELLHPITSRLEFHQCDLVRIQTSHMYNPYNILKWNCHEKPIFVHKSCFWTRKSWTKPQSRESRFFSRLRWSLSQWFWEYFRRLLDLVATNCCWWCLGSHLHSFGRSSTMDSCHFVQYFDYHFSWSAQLNLGSDLDLYFKSGWWMMKSWIRLEYVKIQIVIIHDSSMIHLCFMRIYQILENSGDFFSLRWLWNEQLKHGRMIRNRSWRGSSRSVWRVWRTQTRQRKWQNGMRFRKFIWKKVFSGIGSKNYGDRCIWMHLRLKLMHRMYMNLM